MYKFKFADIGEGLHDGKIIEVFFKENDNVKSGDSLFSVETDKVNAEIPSPVSGVIKKIYFKAGETIHVGEVFVDIDDVSANASQTVDAKQESSVQAVEEEDAPGVIGAIQVSSEVIASRKDESTAVKKSDKTILSTPLARCLAKDLNVDITTINGTGPNGRVLEQDVKNASGSAGIQQGAKTIELPKISVQGSVRKEKMSSIRKAISKAMTNSRTIIPEVTLTMDINVTELVRLRGQLKESALEKGIKLTYMPFIAKATVLSLQTYPILNTTYDHNSEEIIYKNFFNLGIAIDTEAGLIVPVIKGADQYNILQLGAKIADLAKLARDKKLKMDDLKDASFTITNFGSVGVKYATPVINYPESAILGVGSIEEKLVMDKNGNGNFNVNHILPVSLAVDHRTIDGADGGRFLIKLKSLLENPATLLI